MNIPAGKHVVKFRFDPESIHKTETVAYASLAIFFLLVAILGFKEGKKWRKPQE